ncbi:MAG TPA: hypothetical protein VFK20_11600 [Vicinamibacterales bacterium]|nr:hypothetical protein [Vicinamibacterales bacterium]
MTLRVAVLAVFLSAWTVTPQVIFRVPADCSGSGPTICSVSSSTLTDAGTLTITGVNFGTKNPAAPMVWDDGGTSASTSPFTHGYNSVWSHPDDTSGSQSNTDCDEHYRTQAEVVALGSLAAGMPMAHSHMTRYLTGAHCDSPTAGASGVETVFGGVSLPFNVFTSVYEAYDPNWCFQGEAACPVEVDNNFKDFTWSTALGNTGPPSGYWYSVSNDGAASWSWGSDRFDMGSGPSGTNPFGHWRQVQWVMHMARTGGSIALYENGTQRWDVTGVDSTQGDGSTGTDCGSYGSPCFGWWIGGYYRPAERTSQRQYFGDIYIDRTWARVILGNASTYASATTREPQIPSAWSSSSITVTVNLGALSAETAYLYVCDSTNTCSAGFQVTAGS